MKFELEYKHLLSRKCIWKCRLHDGGHFVRVQCVMIPRTWEGPISVGKSHVFASVGFEVVQWYHEFPTGNIFKSINDLITLQYYGLRSFLKSTGFVIYLEYDYQVWGTLTSLIQFIKNNYTLQAFLTHWTVGDLNEILDKWFINWFYWMMNLTGPYWW